MIHIEYASDIGRKRTKNEDSILVNPTSNFIIIADGMGGHNCGDLAGQICVNVVSDHLLNAPISKVNAANLTQIMTDAAIAANCAVLNKATSMAECNGMGTTLLMGLIKGSFLYVLNVGDTKCFIYRNGLTQISQDHTFGNQLLNIGESYENIPKHYWSMLTQCIGHQTLIHPFVNKTRLVDNDLVLFCTDGLTDMLKISEIEKVLISNCSIKSKTGKLVKMANDAGGKDNITLAIYQHAIS